MYRTLLFDVDDTLLDFEAGELQSLAKTFALFDLPYTPAVEAAYLQLNARLWECFEAGEIPREQIFSTRFTQVFKQFHYAADGLLAEKKYHAMIDQEAIRMPHVVDTLVALREYRLYIVSNGVETVQQARLQKAGLLDFFQDVFVSDVIGAPKPTVAFFDYVAKRIPRFDPATTLIIGDSLTSDIQGGINAKLDTAWLNPRFVPNRSAVRPTYTLSDLAELPRLIDAQA
ncbi:YjjG family noncanonical pyrimidine nucleotidase [Lacticaseibacillus daqingensis]|uniref:YjjG family noncanonical pyrimidine nucleotidase n=1 Tax=Lacticaseibacillus daqingensis TaxID=2486014 RepID=UPI000F7AF30A|nr:YjjG family noncanonical pyrimidine nucleotidase [Lacticaseibacillus daqingensis]